MQVEEQNFIELKLSLEFSRLFLKITSPLEYVNILTDCFS